MMPCHWSIRIVEFRMSHAVSSSWNQERADNIPSDCRWFAWLIDSRESTALDPSGSWSWRCRRCCSHSLRLIADLLARAASKVACQEARWADQPWREELHFCEWNRSGAQKCLRGRYRTRRWSPPSLPSRSSESFLLTRAGCRDFAIFAPLSNSLQPAFQCRWTRAGNRHRAYWPATLHRRRDSGLIR